MQRLATLESLRFLFLMLIFMSHFGYEGTPPLDAGGDCGVAFFFVLSGFVTSLGYSGQLRSGTFRSKSFLAKRLLRLYPLHLLCLAVYLAGTRSTFSLPVLLNALLLQSWVPVADFYFSCNAVSWFLCDLLLCYLLFPLLFRVVSGRSVAVALAAYAVCAWLVPEGQVTALLYVQPLVRLADFFLGMALFRGYEQCHRLPRATLLEVGLVLLLVAVLVAYPYLNVKVRTAAVFWPLLLPLTLVFAKAEGRLSAWLQQRWLVALGTLSMPFFMVHKMCIDFLLPRVSGAGYWAALAVCLGAALLASWLLTLVLRRVQKFHSGGRKL